MNFRVQDFQQAAAEALGGPAPGGAVLVGTGDTIWADGFGLADVQAEIAITAGTRFLIGSVSKQFTAMAVLKLAEKGKLGLDDSITRYFPSFPAYGQAVTVRHLLTHTSGIPEYLVDDFWDDPQHHNQDISLAEIIAMIHSYPEPDFLAGTEFSYCNSAYVLLGDIIQQCSDSSFKEYITQLLITPAGMEETQVLENPRQTVANLAFGYQKAPTGSMKQAPYTMATIGWADGNLVSTVGDLYKWHRLLQDQPPVREDWLKVMFSPYYLTNGRPAGYGLGWFLNERRGVREFWHSGGTQGFTCRFSRFPDQDAAIVILTNYETSPRDYLTGVLARIILRDEMRPLTGIVPSEKISQALAGVYRSRRGEMEITLQVQDRTLTGISPAWADFGEIPLLMTEPGIFRLDSPHEYWLQLQQDQDQSSQLIADLNGRRILLNKV